VLAKLLSMPIIGKASCQWQCLLDAAATMDLSNKWTMSLLRLAMHHRRLPEFIPGLVLADNMPALEGVSEWQIWPVPNTWGGRGRGRGRGRAAGRDGAGRRGRGRGPGRGGRRGRGGSADSEVPIDPVGALPVGAEAAADEPVGDVEYSDAESGDAPADAEHSSSDGADDALTSEALSPKSDSDHGSQSSSKASQDELPAPDLILASSSSSSSSSSTSSVSDKEQPIADPDGSDTPTVAPAITGASSPMVASAIIGASSSTLAPPLPPPLAPPVTFGGSCSSSGPGGGPSGGSNSQTGNVSSLPRPQISTFFCGPYPGRVTAYRGVRFQATCRVESHQPNCTRTRTAEAPRGVRIITHAGQGRPAAELVCWLEAAEGLSKIEHELYHASFQDRRSRRAQLKQESAASKQLLMHERPRQDTEIDSEPEFLEV
jgi:hypothetical protein